ncbi:MAG TPA: hypothetical protein PLX20_15635 [Rhodocyclaceae bacterium]|nr:hypothetical protein [Rhodocyclaceae bacterium]HMV55331.1 hypothetical protein [Rhodocyclaceae bacterium]HMZ83655.1 hypothetical protein [Rhodocyclaceae bacterium]HNA02921.1 hypothetical protein [Rhodocyclaceae bacterium]HNB77322.1 hypothetical protein [Rhodocyclaceae bacterium]
MKSPKILPWLAKTSGLPLARVEELWADALRHATLKTGWVNTSDYWKVANEKLRELIEAEALAYHPPEVTPWVLFNMRLGAMPIMAANQVALIWSAAVGRLAKPRRHLTTTRHAA